MDNRIDLLESMLAKTETVLSTIDPADHGRATPCEGFTVSDLLGHVAVWIQVFDAAVNDSAVDFDPATHRVTEGWSDVFAGSSKSTIDGLRARGAERQMTMSGAPLPGELVLNMLLMEYVGHGWDLARSVGLDSPYSDAEASAALTAAQSIIEPQYRGTGMFGQIIEIGGDATPIEAFMAFIGRDPRRELN